MMKYLNWKHFGSNETLFYWTADLFPIDGKWRILATSKPAQSTGRSVKKPWGALEYMIQPAAQDTIDKILTNKYEVTKGRAAIILTAVFNGPVRIEDYMTVQRAKGWSSNIPQGED